MPDVESATLKIPNLRSNANVRAYLAGGGATVALIAAAVIVFVGAATFVAFNGLPFGADDSPDSTVNLAAGVPDAAATAAGPTADAVAADPATPSPAAIDEILAALPPGAEVPGFDPISGSGAGGDDTGTGPPGVGAPPTTGGSGAVGDTVGGVEGAAGDLGLELPLTEAADPITGPVDDAVNDAGNDVGGALGDNQLGDKVTGTVNQAADDVLGPGGVTDSLLGGN
jgi:hypothetical protein